jgi:hypothetical protein
MLLDHNLTSEKPCLSYEKIDGDAIFVGSIINNLYDEKRTKLNSISDKEPKRYSFRPYYNSNEINLYGFLFDIKGQDIFLIKKLREQKQIDLMTYNTILNEFSYSCDENFLRLNQGLYPLDTVHISKFIPNYSYDSLLFINDEIPDFQQFTSINAFILINNKNPAFNN